MPRPLSTSYVAVHQRVAAQRGSASNYECVAPGCAKCAACTGDAWNDTTDRPCACECACHDTKEGD
ncbi:hypothetical protein PP419_gp33 [Microbacterium phage vB_MoxS-R1]|uniref:Uncharacterized protein n=1 Tax=Microbacterium phage vB_MoxS-R1 TaxID=2848881 RepID=A0A8F2E4J1_9CAUD|nr:hypothetical protein PP419_gp33 [Microbacterium phage vB_MoxS-R1]QWT28883.1 hypothetical protein vBMoxSR1_gp33 [Microbacterium phage vB_MoxS-R1]